MLNLDNYYDKDKFMSVSRWKAMSRCEVAGVKPFDDTNRSIPLLVGSYVDAYVEGNLDQFKIDTPEIFTKKIAPHEGTVELLRTIDEGYVTRNNTLNSKKLSEAKRLHEECFDVEYKLKSDYVKADEICEYIDNNSTMQQFLSGEKQTVMTGEIAGVPFKIKMDSYAEGIAISDLKVMRSVTDKEGNIVDFITPWKYDVQLACYQEIVRQNTGNQLPCYIVAVTKESPINSIIVNIPQEVLNTALYRVEETIEELYQAYIGERLPDPCGICKVCIANRTDTNIISMFDIIE